MKTADLNENLIKRMSPAARAQLGVKTAEEAQATFIATSEKSLQKEITKLLRLRNIPFINPAMCKRSELPVGWPDFTCFLNGGRTLFMECKYGNGKRTKEQAQFSDQIMHKGFEYHVVRDLSQARAILDDNPALLKA